MAEDRKNDCWTEGGTSTIYPFRDDICVHWISGWLCAKGHTCYRAGKKDGPELDLGGRMEIKGNQGHSA